MLASSLTYIPKGQTTPNWTELKIKAVLPHTERWCTLKKQEVGKNQWKQHTTKILWNTTMAKTNHTEPRVPNENPTYLELLPLPSEPNTDIHLTVHTTQQWSKYKRCTSMYMQRIHAYYSNNVISLKFHQMSIKICETLNWSSKFKGCAEFGFLWDILIYIVRIILCYDTVSPWQHCPPHLL